MTRTAFKLVRIAALAAPAIYTATQSIPAEQKVNQILNDYTGYNMAAGNWKAERLLRGWGGYLGACLTTYGIPKLIGIIRKL